MPDLSVAVARERPATLAVDIALATAVTVAAVVSVAVVAHDEDRSLPLVAYALIACTGWPLAVRRIWPVATWGVVVVATATYGRSDWPDPPLYLGGLVALFTVASLGTRLQAFAAGAASLALAIIGWLADPSPTDLNDVLTPVLAGSTAWLAGFGTALQRERIDLLRRHAELVEHERDADLERVVADERLRIARELHDVTAHHVTVMAVQAEAGLADPSRAVESLDAVATSARSALSDLRRMLGVLRRDDPASSRASGSMRRPQPGLDELPALADQIRASGLSVDLTVVGEPVTGDGAERTAYRIVQEALTNVVRHADARRVDVRVECDDETIVVMVADDGRGPSRDLVEGHGLRGMRERVALHDGTLEVGPNRPSGLVVRARLVR